MTLPTKTFPQMLNDMTAAWASNLGIVPSLSEGDALLAVFEAVTSQLNFLQGLAQTGVALSRAQTSTGSDLDSFYNQFNYYRQAATYNVGSVTFSTLIPATTQILIYPGAIVQTTGGAIQYSVIADTTQSAWSASLGAYVLPIGSSSVVCTCQALVAGTTYNVIAGQLSQLGSTVSGISTISNSAAIANAINAESDVAFRAGFVQYLASLSQATYSAILAAALQVQQGLTITLLENTNSSNIAQNGTFTAVVNNGTGSPPSTLITEVYNAIYAARAFSVQPFAIAVVTVTAVIALSIRVATGFVASTVEGAVAAAVAAYVNSLPEGATLFRGQIIETAQSVAGVTAVNPSTVTINSSSTDLTCTSIQTIVTTPSNVAVGTY